MFSQPLTNLPELVLSVIICRIDPRWADVSASDIARAAALAAPKTEQARAVSSCSSSRARRKPDGSADFFSRATLHQNPRVQIWRAAAR